MRVIWIKAFNSHSMHSSTGNLQLSQIVQKWHSLRFYIARTGVIESWDLISISKVGRPKHFRAEKTSRDLTTFQFSPANNSFVLLSRTIISVHIIMFCVFDRVYVLFHFHIGVLSDISRCEWYGGQSRNEAAFLAARCTRRHAQSRGRVTEARDVHYICKWVAPNSTASLPIVASFSSLYTVPFSYYLLSFSFLLWWPFILWSS